MLKAIIWLGGLVFVYIGLYLLNKKTPKPAGCENLTAECSGCQMVDCSHHPVHHQEANRE